MTQLEQCLKSLPELAKQQAQIDFVVGDALSLIKESFDPRSWLTQCAKAFPELTESYSHDEIRRCISMSTTYGPAERVLNLPRCMYLYSLRHTDDPCKWVNRAHSESWGFDDLRAQVLSEKKSKRKRPAVEELPKDWLFQEDAIVSTGDLVASIGAYVDLTAADTVPQIQVTMAKEVLQVSEAKELCKVVTRCVSAVEKFLGLVGVVSGMPSELSASCAS